MLTLPIQEVIHATPRARLVRLDLEEQEFTYLAGQAVLVGVPGIEKRRPYSIAGAPEDARSLGYIELLIGVDAAGQAGDYLPLEPGTRIEVEGPTGNFTFPEAPSEHSVIFVAGGTGIAPLRSMLRHAIADVRSGIHVGLLYSARTPEEFAFEDEFRALAAAGRIDFRQTITRETDRHWTGQRGRIDGRILSGLVRDRNSLCFVCGPAAMVDDVPRLLSDVGVPKEKIRIEEW